MDVNTYTAILKHNGMTSTK